MTTAIVPVRSRTKLATYIGAGVLAAVTVLFGARALLIELRIPSSLWLEEVRVLDGTNHGLAFLSSGSLSWLSIGAKDPAILYERFGDCQRRQSEAVQARDAERLRIEQLACLLVVNAILQAAPANSSAWLENARLYLNLKGPDEQFYQSLRMSFSTGPLEGWIAARRLPVALEVWDSASPDLRDAAATDVRTLTQSDTLVAALADIYVRNPRLQKVITEVVDGYADQVGKQRFIDALQKVIEVRKTSGLPAD